MALVVSLFLATVLSRLAAFIASLTARERIETQEPDYFRRLFNSAGDVFVLNLLPFRWDTLFFVRAPASLKTSIVRLRCLYAAHGVATGAFLCHIAYGFVGDFGRV